MAMGINHRKWEGMGLKKIFPLISSVNCGSATSTQASNDFTAQQQITCCTASATVSEMTDDLLNLLTSSAPITAQPTHLHGVIFTPPTCALHALCSEINDTFRSYMSTQSVERQTSKHIDKPNSTYLSADRNRGKLSLDCLDERRMKHAQRK